MAEEQEQEQETVEAPVSAPYTIESLIDDIAAKVDEVKRKYRIKTTEATDIVAVALGHSGVRQPLNGPTPIRPVNRAQRRHPRGMN